MLSASATKEEAYYIIKKLYSIVELFDLAIAGILKLRAALTAGHIYIPA